MLFEQRETRLLYALLPLLQAEQPGVALASLVFRTDQRADHRVVRDFCKARLISFDLVREAIQFGPVDLLIVSVHSR